MANYTSKIFNNATSALSAQQAVIANIGNNIANANTPGYARRVVNLETRTSLASGGVNVGSGVTVAGVQRVTDEFLQKVLREAQQGKSDAQVQDDFVNRLEGLFSLSGESETIGSSLTNFFLAIDQLAKNPSSIELRTNLLESMNTLVNNIKSTFNEIAHLQTEADDRIATEIDAMNALTQQIADLNAQVSTRESTGQVAADERDQRDRLLEQLAEKVGFSLLEQQDGSVDITLANGFPLVSGNTARLLETTKSPSFSTGTLPASLEGGVLSYIVYDFDTTAGQAHLDLSDMIGAGGGTIGGLIAMRGTNDATNTSPFEGTGFLVDMASRVESIARNLIFTMNRINVGDDALDGSADRDPATAAFFDPISGDLDGQIPGVYGLFTFAYSGASRDTDSNGLADDLADLTDISDVNHVDNFASILQVAITDPRDVAAARDVSGGPPAAAQFPTGDARNLNALSNMRNAQLTFAVGPYARTTTFDGAYNETVGAVGNKRTRTKVDLAVAEGNLTTAIGRRDEVSAVSLDEEFTNMIRYQKAFEASARLIRVGEELLDQIVSLV